MKTITTMDLTWEELTIMKIKLKHKTLDQTINHLIHTADKDPDKREYKNISNPDLSSGSDNASEVKAKASSEQGDKVPHHTPIKKEENDRD